MLAPLVFLAVSLLVVANPRLALAFFAGYLASIWVLLAVRTRVVGELVRHFIDHPALLVAVTFIALIAFGTLFLSLPAASAGGSAVSPIDALFTATSATCVTGLIVRDTPIAFSFFGHLVILVLIQIGGLNIMVLSTFAALLLGRGLGLRGERALGAILDVQQGRSAYRLIIFIVLTTFLVEGVGAAGLTLAYRMHGFSLLDSAWKGVFHAVSAFCNAGFALQSDSLTMFQNDPLPLLLVAALITLGGLGFTFLAFAWSRLRRRAELGFSVQARLVLLASGVLVVGGTLFIAAAEWNRALAGLTPGTKLINALFQSVTLRTAGFNSVPLDSLRPVTVLVMMAFMFIGASPGGTGRDQDHDGGHPLQRHPRPGPGRAPDRPVPPDDPVRDGLPERGDRRGRFGPRPLRGRVAPPDAEPAVRPPPLRNLQCLRHSGIVSRCHLDPRCGGKIGHYRLMLLGRIGPPDPALLLGGGCRDGWSILKPGSWLREEVG